MPFRALKPISAAGSSSINCGAPSSFTAPVTSSTLASNRSPLAEICPETVEVEGISLHDEEDDENERAAASRMAALFQAAVVRFCPGCSSSSRRRQHQQQQPSETAGNEPAAEVLFEADPPPSPTRDTTLAPSAPAPAASSSVTLPIGERTFHGLFAFWQLPRLRSGVELVAVQCADVPGGMPNPLGSHPVHA